MDRDGTRSPLTQRKALDGFFSKPATNARMRPDAARLRPSGTGVPASRRSVDNFRRSDGLHTAPRRPLATTGHQGSAARPRPIESRPGVHGAPAAAPARRTRHSKKTSRLGTARKWIFRTTALSLLLVLVTGGFLFGKGYFKLQKVFQGGSSAVALSEQVDPVLLKGEGDGRINVLLLGSGGERHKGGDLTDTVMVASIDPVNNQAVLLSIPRDLWTRMPNNVFGSYNKINAAYESGKYKHLGRQDASNKERQAVLAGFQGVDGVVERVTGTPIHYNVLVDFKAFSQAVDTVGGITVTAEEDLYDPTMSWENGWSPVLAKKGVNSFNGKQALNYVRSRQTSSDFARGERQRQVMLALKEKTTDMGTLTNPVKLSNLLNAFGDNVQADISVQDMTRLAQIMKRIPSSQIQSVGLTEPGNALVTTGNINGMSVVMPKAGLEDYSKIQTYIRSKMKDGFIAKENAAITVLNGTSKPGLAGEKADELKSYGYNVGLVDNAPTEDYAKTTIVDLSGGSKKYTLNYLKKRLNVQQTTTTLPAGVSAGSANIVIILGSDETTSTQN